MVQTLNGAVEDLHGVAGTVGEDLVVDFLARGGVGVGVVLGDVLEEVQFDTDVERGDDVEDSALVVVGRPVPGGFGAEEFEAGVGGQVLGEGVFGADAEGVGQLEVAAEGAHFVVASGVLLGAEEHGGAKADGGVPVQAATTAGLVAVEEVGPVEGDEAHQRDGVGVEGLVVVVGDAVFVVGGHSGEVDERLQRIARLAVDVHEVQTQRYCQVGDDPLAYFGAEVVVQLVPAGVGFHLVADEGLYAAPEVDPPVVEGGCNDVEQRVAVGTEGEAFAFEALGEQASGASNQ